MTARGSVVTPMPSATERRAATLRFADDASAFPEALRRALEGGTTTVTIDLAGIEHLDPSALQVLATAAESARAAGAALRFEGARPIVYKALHIAKIAG